MTEIAAVDQSTAMMQVIAKVASDPNSDVDKLEKMLNMQERIFDKNAAIEFNKSLTKCQQEMPAVTANAQNNQTNSKYAKIEAINKVITPVYTDNGFSLSFGEGKPDKEGFMRIECTVAHSGGHSKEYHYDLPLDDSGMAGKTNKTKVHAHGSTTSYGRRYLTLLIFNIIIVGEDDDGTAGNKIITQEDLYNAFWDGRELGINIGKLWTSIEAIKKSIESGDLGATVEAMEEITPEEKQGINRAPTKGGPFTVDENKVIRSDEWFRAKNKFYGRDNAGDSI